MDKPIFPLDTSQSKAPPPSELIEKIQDGEFDTLFGDRDKISQIAQEAAKGLPPPTIKIESVFPVEPISNELPNYPPIAKLAHVEGLVEATFDVDYDGIVRDIAFVSEPKSRMLQPAVSQALSKWKFPTSAEGKSGKVSIRFKLNCGASPK